MIARSIHEVRNRSSFYTLNEHHAAIFFFTNILYDNFRAAFQDKKKSAIYCSLRLNKPGSDMQITKIAINTGNIVSF